MRQQSSHPDGAPHEEGSSATNQGTRRDELLFSVVIPLNNEQANVAPLVGELRSVLAGSEPYELIIVDDGSTDETSARVHGLANGRLRLLRHDTRRGQSTAIYNGVRSASAELVVLMDGDLQNDPADIQRLLDVYRANDDGHMGLVIGHRVNRQDSALRIVASRIANALRAAVLHDDTPDTGCGLKLIPRSVFMQLPYFEHMHRFLPALVRAAGFRVISVPVNHRRRVHETGHYGIWNRLWIGIVDVLGVAWLARRSVPRDYFED